MPHDDSPDIVETLSDAGYEIAFDTGVPDSEAPPTVSASSASPVPESNLPAESTLPSEAIIPRRGRPKLSPTVFGEGGEVDGPKRYLGSDGVYHTEVPRAAKAFEDYFNMGATRSLARLANKYFIEKSPGWEQNESEPAIMRKLGEYSSNLDWQNRIRLALARQSARAVTNAQKQAAHNRTERIRRAQKLQDIAETIFDRAMIIGADAESLPPEVARQLIKPATNLMEIGMIQERLEAGESLERIKPPKAIDQMTEDELDEYIELLRSER